MEFVKDGVGVVEQKENFTVIKKVGKKGEEIPKHNHPEANVLFTVVKGEVLVIIDGVENVVKPGKIISFDGNSYINAKMIEDSEIFVTLILK